tara:strand:+ start:98 stop:580 length:483 start_codon:yes stop_codon:yes gene_type:complete
MNNPKKNIGFKVPLKYFKKLEQKILREIKEGVNIQNNFFVPQNYFNNFKPNFLTRKKTLGFNKKLLIIGSGFSIILIILLFTILNQNNQKEEIKTNKFYTDIESELRIKPLKALEISRSIENIDYEIYNSNFNNFRTSQIDANQIYFNNSFNIYYEESDY